MAPVARYLSENVSPEPLGRPLIFEFSHRTAPNRFLKGAMRWGEGGIGIILTGSIMIEYDHLGAGNAVIHRKNRFNGERFEAFKEMATQGRKHGMLMVGQVNHPGRQVNEKIQKYPISASDIQLEGNLLGMTFAKPRTATHEDINNVIEGFAHAAEYLDKAGFDGIQLHGAHGYLIAQFLSLTTNRRTDKYGGSIENRARLIIEISEEIRKRTSSGFILGIKLNSVEFQDHGFCAEEARQLCTLLEKNGFDFVELSGGTYESLAFEHKRESTKKREAFFLEFADLVGATVQALDTVDGVGLARPLCQEPQLCKDMLENKVKGAILQEVDNYDYGLSMVIAGVQMRQIGKNYEPINMGVVENVAAFMRDLRGWAEESAADKKMVNFGLFDITSVTPIPYRSLPALA